jgi:hypothetical protein
MSKIDGRLSTREVVGEVKMTPLPEGCGEARASKAASPLLESKVETVGEDGGGGGVSRTLETGATYGILDNTGAEGIP